MGRGGAWSAKHGTQDAQQLQARPAGRGRGFGGSLAVTEGSPGVPGSPGPGDYRAPDRGYL